MTDLPEWQPGTVAVQDHTDARFVIEDGVRWTWTHPEARRRDAQIRAAPARLAG